MDRIAFHLLLSVLWLATWANDIGVLVGYRVKAQRGEASACRYVVGLSIRKSLPRPARRPLPCPLVARVR